MGSKADETFVIVKTVIVFTQALFATAPKIKAALLLFAIDRKNQQNRCAHLWA